MSIHTRKSYSDFIFEYLMIIEIGVDGRFVNNYLYFQSNQF